MVLEMVIVLKVMVMIAVMVIEVGVMTGSTFYGELPVPGTVLDSL